MSCSNVLYCEIPSAFTWRPRLTRLLNVPAEQHTLGELLRRILCFVVFFVCLLAGAHAQTAHSTAGKLSGVVTDPSGAVIPGATIHVERHGSLDSQIPNVTSD